MTKRKHYTGQTQANLTHYVNRFAIEVMPNGLTRVLDRESGLTACYYTDTGIRKFGDLRYTLNSIRAYMGAK